MKALTEFAAFIFDMDGLVLDTEPTYYTAWKAAVNQMGFATEGYSFGQLSGQQYRVVEAQILAWYGDSFNLATFRQLGKQLWRDHILTYGIGIKTGVIEMLDFADSLHTPYCLATNSYRTNAEECLTVSGIKPRFPVIIAGDEVTSPKPAPDIFLKAAAQLQAAIADCLVFEDSPAGVSAAVAAGATCVYVPSVLPADPYSLTIADFKADNLLQVLQRLSSPC